MGCDIHAYVEVFDGHNWNYEDECFDFRNYGIFGFLADVRNYSDIPPLSTPRGIPSFPSREVSIKIADWDGDGHSHSWLSLKELLDFDYSKIVEDRRYTKQEGPNFFNGAATCEPGQGKFQTWREFLGDHFLKELDELKELGDPANIRIVFWFDN